MDIGTEASSHDFQASMNLCSLKKSNNKIEIKMMDLVGLLARQVSSYFHTTFSPNSSPVRGL